LALRVPGLRYPTVTPRQHDDPVRHAVRPRWPRLRRHDPLPPSHIGEGNPVHLEPNGLFDDDAYIASFRRCSGLLTDDRRIDTTVSLRTAAADCAGSETTSGDALLLITIPPTRRSVDFDGDGDEGTDADIEAFFALLVGPSHSVLAR